MIKQIEKELTKVLEKRLVDSRDLYFLKYNTALSGTGLGNKVLLFVFGKGQSEPIAVVKTVRSYTDASVIRSGFTRLMQLNTQVKDIECSALFPEALSLYDAGHEIFSVESVCVGRKSDVTKDLPLIMGQYTKLSQYMQKQLDSALTLTAQYGKKLIDALEGPQESKDYLWKYCAEIWGDTEIVLPSISQHGDFTFDNIRVEKEVVHIIDCDTFGAITIPGYDIFHLIVRSKLPSWKDIFFEYWKHMELPSVPDKRLFFLYYLHELFIKKDYILKRKSVEVIIAEFEGFMV